VIGAAPAERLRGTLRASQASSRSFLIGAAIGTGMAAQAAARGGADFLLALNAGRLRSMGEPSVASLLALRDTNRVVMDFAQTEIRSRTKLPVFVGLAAFDPRLDPAGIARQVLAAGFDGISNFPTVALIDGRFRRFLEASGFGFEREVALLRAARDHGLATLAYVHTPDEARRMAGIGVDIVNIDLGWNTGGTLGVATSMQIDDAAEFAGRMVRSLRKVAADTICVVEGGPIVRPEQMDHVCRAAQADGYIGGSTIDRVPLETAIELVTSAFKTMGALRRHVMRLERRLDPRLTPLGIVGGAPAVERARAAFHQAQASDLPVLIAGEPGVGRRDLARAVHAGSVRKARRLTWLTCAEGKSETDLDLFGSEPGAAPGIVRRRIGWLELARGSTLVLDDLADLEPATQRRLCAAIESGGFRRLGGTETLPFDTRLVCITRHDPGAEPERFGAALLQLVSGVRIDLPPLRSHLDDLPLVIQHVLDNLTLAAGEKQAGLDPAAYRTLLGYDWPGNLRELTSVLQRALLASGGMPILPEHIPPLHAAAGPDAKTGFPSEREWILDGLRRNRFRRTETARFLGVSRKTLYNKMVALGLHASTAGRASGKY
jgi:predicted TIM-barrel enzyme/DNA-binding NtrC family response regulator